MKECPICKKQFVSDVRFQVYCSPVCRGEARRAKEREYRAEAKQSISKTCTNCGKPFTAHAVSQKYCSYMCRQLYFQSRHRINTAVSVTCKTCGTQFIANTKVKKYCSRKCAYEAIKQSNRGGHGKPEQRRCRCCKELFQPISRSSVYCSSLCREEVEEIKASARASLYAPLW